MLTSSDTCSNEEYASKLSPGSYSDYSSGSSDEDFLQFPSELDMPSLLTIDDHDINALNTILDQSTDEILSEISSPHSTQANEKLIIFKDAPVKIRSKSITFDDGNSTSSKTSNKRKLGNDYSLKNIPPQIVPKKSTFVNDQVVVIGKSQNDQFNVAPQNIIIKNESNGFVQSVFTKPSQVITQPVFVNELNPMVFEQYKNVDPKTLKKLQRKIKNRESACLSRKKKKDYLNSLEVTVNNLTAENEKLKKENSLLRIKLSQYENNCKPFEMKRKIGVCMFLLVLCLNLNIFKGDYNQNFSQVNIQTLQNHYGRSLLSVSDNDGEEYPSASKKNASFSMCPVAINQSESARLVLNLERWIGKPFNLTKNTQNEINSNIKISRRKYWKRKKFAIGDSELSVYPVGRKTKRYPKKETNELQIFSPFNDQIYSDFFEAINRQDDTFYVVSFSENNMLLPALHHNRTRRPKMSLIMPTIFDGNFTQPSIKMMKIDCEVQDTQMINVNHGAIFQHFKKAGNVTNSKKEEPKGKPDTKANAKKFKKAFKPFFINDNDIMKDSVEYTLN